MMFTKDMFSRLGIFLILFMVSGSFIAHAKFEIEQVQINKPQVNIYIRGGVVEDVGQIRAQLGSEQLKVLSSANHDEGNTYFFLVDISGSITEAEMQLIRNSINEIVAEVGEDDKVILITFGEAVKTVLNGNESIEEVKMAIEGLTRTDLSTLFYDGLKQCIDMSSVKDSDLPNRKVAFVFSDGVDEAESGRTKDELLNLARTSNVPFYGFGVGQSRGNASGLNAFSEVSNASGGQFKTIISTEEVMSTYRAIEVVNVIKCAAKNNRNVLGETTLKLNIQYEGKEDALTRDAKELYSIPDITSPEVQIFKISNSELRLEFSEQVVGADEAGNYAIKHKSDSPSLQSVTYDSNNFVAVLTFSDDLATGTMEFEFPNITDDSQEENKLAAVEFEMEGVSPVFRGFVRISLQFWWLVLIIAIVIVAVAWYIIIDKRRGIVFVDGRVTFGDRVDEKHHFALPSTVPLKLLIHEMSGQVRELVLNVHKSIFVGRASICDVYFDDPQLSRQHFAIEEENGEFYITNLSSTNGTFVNGVELKSRRKLYMDDVIIAGAEKIVFRGSPNA